MVSTMSNSKDDDDDYDDDNELSEDRLEFLLMSYMRDW
jgi:hypothetical protein